MKKITVLAAALLMLGSSLAVGQREVAIDCCGVVFCRRHPPQHGRNQPAATDPLDVQSAVMIHVYPTNDLREHDTGETAHCACRPRIEIVRGTTLVIHYSWDGREILENAREHAFSTEGRN